MDKTVTKRESKHSDIMSSIGDLERAVKHLNCLLEEIRGNETEKSPETVPCPSHLSYMMDNAASMIQGEVERISNLTAGIREEIF